MRVQLQPVDGDFSFWLRLGNAYSTPCLECGPGAGSGPQPEPPPVRRDLLRPRMYLCLQSFCITACISFQNQYSRTLPTPSAVVIAVRGGWRIGGGGFAAPQPGARSWPGAGGLEISFTPPGRAGAQYPTMDRGKAGGSGGGPPQGGMGQPGSLQGREPPRHRLREGLVGRGWNKEFGG